MSDLQTAYYIIGIIFMGVLLLIMVVMVVALLVIRAKITAIHKHIEDKLSVIMNLADKGSAVVGAIKKVTKSSKR